MAAVVKSERVAGVDATKEAKRTKKKMATPKGVGDETSTLAPADVGTSGRRKTEKLTPIGHGFVITASQVQVARAIVSFMNEKGASGLSVPSNQEALIAKGKTVARVHPLVFMWALFSDQITKETLKRFSKYKLTFLWSGFLGYSGMHDEGLGKKLEAHYKGKSFEDCEAEFNSLFEALNMNKDKMIPLLKTALEKNSEQGADEESSGIRALLSKAKAISNGAFSGGSNSPFEPFIRAFTMDDSYNS